MTRQRSCYWIWLAGILLLFSRDATAQYVLNAQVTAAGGGLTSDGGRFVHATFGQGIIGRTNGDNNTDAQGFWHTRNGKSTSTSSTPGSTHAAPGSYNGTLSVTPNPFSGSTEIRFFMPIAGHVTLALYDLLGRHVTTILDRTTQSGDVVVGLDAGDLASGKYTAVLHGPGLYQTIPVTVVQ